MWSYFNIYVIGKIYSGFSKFSSFRILSCCHTTMNYLRNANFWHPEGPERNIKVLCQPRHLIFWFRKCHLTAVVGKNPKIRISPWVKFYSTAILCCFKTWTWYNKYLKKALSNKCITMFKKHFLKIS